MFAEFCPRRYATHFVLVALLLQVGWSAQAERRDRQWIPSMIGDAFFDSTRSPSAATSAASVRPLKCYVLGMDPKLTGGVPFIGYDPIAGNLIEKGWLAVPEGFDPRTFDIRDPAQAALLMSLQADAERRPLLDLLYFELVPHLWPGQFDQAIATGDTFTTSWLTGSPEDFPVYAIVGPPILQAITGGNAAAAPGAGVGRSKLTENSSPIPRDRLFCDGTFMQDARLLAGGVHVQRVTPGFETTFLAGDASLEVRFPFASTVRSDLTTVGAGSGGQMEFGNLTLFLKTLLWESENWALSAGVGASLPTADDFVVRTPTSETLLRVDSESIHVLPFVGGMVAPSNRCLIQGILQFDLDTRGNTVRASDWTMWTPPRFVSDTPEILGSPTGNLTPLGVARDRDLMFLDISCSYWLYENAPDNNARLQGVAAVMEYHLNQSLGGGNRVTGSSGGTHYDFGRAPNFSISNAVLGLTVILSDGAQASVGYVAPLTSNRAFDGTLRLQCSWVPTARR